MDLDEEVNMTTITAPETGIASNIDEALHSLAGIDLRTVKNKNVRSDIKQAREILRAARKTAAA